MLRISQNGAAMARALRNDLNQLTRYSVTPVNFAPVRALSTSATRLNLNVQSVLADKHSQESLCADSAAYRGESDETSWPSHKLHAVGDSKVGIHQSERGHLGNVVNSKRKFEKNTSRLLSVRSSHVAVYGKSSTNAIDNKERVSFSKSVSPLELLFYEGQGVEGRIYGQGRLTYPDGRTHEGNFTQSKAVGGVSTRVSTRVTTKGDIYVGEFKDGMMHGQGKITLAPIEEGQLWNGKDKLTMRNNGCYEGEFENNKYHGQGKFTYPDGRSHEGEFKEGKLWNGKGVMKLKDGAVYEGGFKDGKHHGPGKLIYSDGRIQEGDFMHGRLYTGKASFVLKDGSRYDGTVQKNKRNGAGKLTFPNGTIWEGQFIENKFVQGKIINADGKTQEGEFKDGIIWNGVSAQKDGVLCKRWVDGKEESLAVPVVQESVNKPSTEKARSAESVPTKRTATEKTYKAVPSAVHKISSTDSTAVSGKIVCDSWTDGIFIKDKGPRDKFLATDMTTPTYPVDSGSIADPLPSASQPLKAVQVNNATLTTLLPLESSPSPAKAAPVYVGERRAGVCHGAGKLTFPDGNVWEGRWEEGEFVEGKITYSNGKVLEGVWEKKVFVRGKITLANGGWLEGEFKSDILFAGKGKMHLKSGDVYEGEIKEGKMHGQGKLYYTEGRAHALVPKVSKRRRPKSIVNENKHAVYEGGFYEGERHGQGKITYPDGSTWEGELLAGMLWNGKKYYKDGRVIKTWTDGKTKRGNASWLPDDVSVYLKVQYPDGSFYEGEFVQYKRHGAGRLTSASGEIFEGIFDRDVPISGQGVLPTLKEAVLQARAGQMVGKIVYPDGTVHEGRWQDRQFVEGKRTELDGTVYEGIWVNGKFAKGRITYAHGDWMEGELTEGSMTGTGRLTLECGGVFEGALKMGKPSQGKITYRDGRIYQGNFRDAAKWNGTETNGLGQVTKVWIEGKESVANIDFSPPDSSVVSVRFTNKQGAVFEGVYLDESKQRGRGRITYPDGYVYEGEWLEDKKHGEGRLTNAAGEVFEGLFEDDGAQSGKGKLCSEDGSYIEGSFCEGLLRGQGKIVEADGTVWEGRWEDGNLCVGKVVRPNGEALEGEFEEGMLCNGSGTLISESGEVYEGGFQNFLKHRQGKVIYPDGRSQEGEFQEGKLWNGQGTLVCENGAVYEGEVREGMFYGQGKLTYPDGRTLEGKFRKDKLWSGKGVVITADGEDYEGEIQKGQRHGQGKLVYPNGSTWEGEFNQGKLWNGAGTLVFKSGNVYEGELKSGKMHGQGKVTYPDGRFYEGEFREGQLWNGAGTLITMSGIIYEGEFQEGKRHGQGKITHPDGRVLEGEFQKDKIWNGSGSLTLKSGDVYEGEFQEGKMHGQGKITIPNGRSLEGEFRQGKLWNGAGTLVYEDGDMHEGEFREGKKHGQGKTICPDGRTLEGEFREDKLWHGTGTLTHTNGEVYKGEVREGKYWNGSVAVVYGNKEVFQGEYKEGKLWNGVRMLARGLVKNRWMDGQEGIVDTAPMDEK